MVINAYQIEYELVGDKSRVCQVDGSWTGKGITTCICEFLTIFKFKNKVYHKIFTFVV